MKIPTPIPVTEGRAIVRKTVKPGRVETVNVLDAIGRVLAEDLFSDIDVAPFDDSGMDGFGVVAADLDAATADAPVQLECVAHIGAGDVYEGVVGPGQTVRIMTGAMVPDGVDAVVKIEDVTYEGDGSVGSLIGFSAPTKPGANIRLAGEETKAGEKVMEAGEVITAAGAGLLATCGNLQVSVYARPKVGIISIGSELVDATEKPGKGMIRNSNIWAMQAYIAQAGGIAVPYPTVADDVDAIKAVYLKAVEECDMVVSTGGACLGDFDLTGDILRELGEMLFERCNVKPGKSQPFGLINGKPVFVLSGNPAASSVGFELYARLAMRIMQGYKELDRPTIQARVQSDVNKRDPRLFLERGIFAQAADGTFEVTLLKKQSSALFGALQHCNCLAIIPEGTEGVKAGDMVTCIVISADESMPLRA